MTNKKLRTKCLKVFRKMGLSFKASARLVSFKKKMGDFNFAEPMTRHWPHYYAEILAKEGYEIVDLTGCVYDDLDFSERKYFAGYSPCSTIESWLIVKHDNREIKIPANFMAGEQFKISRQ